MKLDSVVNWVVIAAAVSVIGFNVYDRLLPREDGHEARARILVGQSLPLPPAIDPGRSVTAVLFVSRHCQFCSESMSFYTRISSLRSPQSGSFRLLAITPLGRETADEDKVYLAGHHLSVDGLTQLQFDDLGIHGTPTLALLDGKGRVFKAWTGKLPPATEREIVRIIRGLCPECRSA